MDASKILARKPAEWFRQADNAQFVETLNKKFEGGSDPLLKTFMSRYGDTHAQTEDRTGHLCYYKCCRKFTPRPSAGILLHNMPTHILEVR